MPILQTGTHDISALRELRFQSVLSYGLDNLAVALQRDMDIHNAMVQDMIGTLAFPTTERGMVYGVGVNGEMIERDEYTRAPTQRAQVGAAVDFPLRSFQRAIGWTADFFRRATVADMAEAQVAQQRAHLNALHRGVARALFRATNYTAYDYTRDNYELKVKALLNGDGAPIPGGPTGESFDPATHSHYLGIAANPNAEQLDAALHALLTHVIEHGHGEGLKLIISRTNEQQVRATPSFYAYTDPRVAIAITDTAARGTLDITRVDNRAIGIFGPAEVWVRSWAVTNYFLATAVAGPPTDRPLAFRQHPEPEMQGLRLRAQNLAFPLYAEYVEADFGFGAYNRTNGAVLHVGNTTYQEPNIG